MRVLFLLITSNRKKMRSGSMVGVNRSFFLLLHFYLNLCFLFGKSARKDSFIRGWSDIISERRGRAR